MAEQIRDEIAEKLALGELRDPRIGFTTITRVEVSPDLSHARILVSVLGSEEIQASTIAGLSSAAGYLRREITHRLKLRRAPELSFILDHGPEEALKIEGLLDKLRNTEK